MDQNIADVVKSTEQLNIDKNVTNLNENNSCSQVVDCVETGDSPSSSEQKAECESQTNTTVNDDQTTDATSTNDAQGSDCKSDNWQTEEDKLKKPTIPPLQLFTCLDKPIKKKKKQRKRNENFTIVLDNWNVNSDNLPTQPIANQPPKIDTSLVSNVPPFIAYIGTARMELNNEDLKRFFLGIDIKNVTQHKTESSTGFARESIVCVEFTTRQFLIQATKYDGCSQKNREVYIKLTLEELVRDLEKNRNRHAPGRDYNNSTINRNWIKDKVDFQKNIRGPMNRNVGNKRYDNRNDQRFDKRGDNRNDKYGQKDYNSFGNFNRSYNNRAPVKNYNQTVATQDPPKNVETTYKSGMAPPQNFSSVKGASDSNIFGLAKPVDTNRKKIVLEKPKPKPKEEVKFYQPSGNRYNSDTFTNNKGSFGQKKSSIQNNSTYYGRVNTTEHSKNTQYQDRNPFESKRSEYKKRGDNRNIQK
ncbi:hypothetical protein A3Q56_02725 [Intoshia linei]|uniref:RRM domain-containing protein n=1 Tax=Intoshia linei TaxID=1819745 RepID=A0A177B5E8_9BILA|nr:hypothetical protein A3Q56_02725 [Intoshia linei]